MESNLHFATDGSDIDLKLPKSPRRLSRLCHTLSRGDVGVVFHSLSMLPIFINAELLPFVASLRSGQDLQNFQPNSPQADLFACLDRYGMLVDVNADEYELVREIANEHLGTPRISVLYLVVTDDCNFACSYCAVESRFAEPTVHTRLTASHASQAILLFRKYVDRSAPRPRIVFYGGEPMLNFELIKSATNLVEHLIKRGDLPQTTRIHVITNGSLLTDQSATWLAQHQIQVSVSMDGRQFAHDSSRKLRSGHGTFDLALRGYRCLQSKGIRPSISWTITEENVDHLLPDVEWIVDELDPPAMGFTIRIDTPGHVRTTDRFVMEATQALLACFQLLRSRGISEDRVTRKARSLASGQIWIKDCAGCGNQLVISPHGRIGVCQAYTATGSCFPGDLNQSEPFNPSLDPVFREWSNRSPLSMPACYSCIALGNCGGGCPAGAECVSGSIWCPDERFCVFSRATLEWLIWDIHKQRSATQVAH